jgi:hypothetical protein
MSIFIENGTIINEGFSFTGGLFVENGIISALNIYDYNCHDEAKVLNVDDKLAMIVDDVRTVIELTASANTKVTRQPDLHRCS